MKPLLLFACAALLLHAGPGCSAVNGLYFGLEEDVDAFVSALDKAGDGVLPHGPRPPLEARRGDRQRVRFEPPPGGDGRIRTTAAGPRSPGRASYRTGPSEGRLAPGVRRGPPAVRPQAVPAAPAAPHAPRVAATRPATPEAVAWPPPRHHALVIP